MLTIPRRFWTWLTASRKRFSLACALALVGLLLWSRLILVSNMPRTAVAGDEDETAQRDDGNASPEASSDKAGDGTAQGESEIDPNAAPRVSPR